MADPTSRLTFSEIELPAEPGMNDTLLFLLTAVVCIVIFLALRAAYSKHKPLLRALFGYYYLVYRYRNKSDSTRQLAGAISQLISKRINMNCLPAHQQLPDRLTPHSERWQSFKHQLEQAKFARASVDHNDLQRLLRECHYWIRAWK